MKGLDRWLTTEPNCDFEDFTEAVVEKVSDYTYALNEYLFEDMDSIIWIWLEKLFNAEKYYSTCNTRKERLARATQILERAIKIFVK